ncbi:MAG: NYN domain-containing protein [Chlamydiota bacterium]
MHYFIDGYNFLFQLYEEIDPLRQKRDEVIEILQEKLRYLKLNITIVFDSHYAQGNFFPTRFDHLSLEIIYTPSGQTADSYILEALTWKKNRNQETVITSDKRLGKLIQELGVKVEPIEAFIPWILKKELQHHRKEYKHTLQESPREFKRLLEAFEKNFKNEES